MSKISFKNFRGFIDFPEMEFEGITFLVGKNNSGKSTAIKAYEFISDYLRSKDLTCISFERAKEIKSFKKMLCNKTDDDIIEFEFINSIYRFTLTLSKINENPYQPKIKFSIKDIKLGYEIVVSTDSSELPYKVSFISEKVIGQPYFDSCFYVNDLSFLKLFEILEKEFVSYLKHYNKKINQFENEDVTGNENVSVNIHNFNKLSYEELQKDVMTYYKIWGSITGIISFFNCNLLFYEVAYAHSFQSKEVSLLNINDGDNLLAEVVHLYYRIKIGTKMIITSRLDQSSNKSKGNIDTFMKKWMSTNGFGIGDDFKIECVNDDYYSLLILKDNEWMNINEMGLGTIRMMTTLLSLAYSLNNARVSGKSIFVFEEPELNLHPALQSKLADLFYEVHNLSDGKINIIVETHSEYIIRRSQVLVAENKLETKPNHNPFKIYYFNDKGDKKQYQIKYNEDGFLKNGFGPGFFDEATSSTLELMRLRKLNLN